jgi:hypothetical protein
MGIRRRIALYATIPIGIWKHGERKHMRWSSLKHQVEERFAESLRGRIALHDTWYRHAGHDRVGRVWLTIDGQEIANFCAFRYWNAARPLIDQAKARGLYFIYDATRERLNAGGIFDRDDAHDALHWSLSSSVDEMLGSDSGIVRALAMLDRRLGKRRLTRLTLAPDEITLVRGCYALRCEAEGLVPATVGDLRIGPPERYSEAAITQRVERKRRYYQRFPRLREARSTELLAQYAEETRAPDSSLDPSDAAGA